MTIPNLFGILALSKEMKNEVKLFWKEYAKRFPGEKTPKGQICSGFQASNLSPLRKVKNKKTPQRHEDTKKYKIFNNNVLRLVDF